jgi:hypothetical protein
MFYNGYTDNKSPKLINMCPCTMQIKVNSDSKRKKIPRVSYIWLQSLSGCTTSHNAMWLRTRRIEFVHWSSYDRIPLRSHLFIIIARSCKCGTECRTRMISIPTLHLGDARCTMCMKWTHIGLVMSVCLSAWFNSRPARRMWIKFGMDVMPLGTSLKSYFSISYNR